MAADNRKIAENVISCVGGRDNVASLMNCMTRLRFVLKDESVADDEKVKAVNGVKGLVKQGGQYQVIIGTNVAKVAEAASEMLGIPLGAAEENTTAPEKGTDEKGSWFNRFFKMISGCIFPFMGLMIASGMIKGILTLLTTLGLSDAGGTYQLLYAGADGLMYFMPIIIGFSAGKQFGTNPYLSAAVGAALVYPNIVSLYDEGAALTFLGIPVVLTSYGNSVFPVILAAWVTSKVEKFWKKVVPDMISIMFVPFLTLVVVVPLTFLAIGPVMSGLSSILANGVNSLWSFSAIIAGTFLGAFWQVIVIFGLHYAFIPILMNNIALYGVDPINAVLGMTVMALTGAGLGYALKQKNVEKKTEGLTCALTAFFGVTEPIIYSIALPKKKPFVAAFVGGGISGAILAASGASMQGFGNGGIFQTFMMISPTDSMNVVWFAISSAVAVAVSFIVAFIICEREEVPVTETVISASASELSGFLSVGAPVKGIVMAQKDIPDETFASGILGGGVGIDPAEGLVVAPFDGEITSVVDTGHAVGISSLDGMELLIHVGVDTVKMKGEGFRVFVKEGDHVKAGQKLMEFDLAKIRKAGFSPVTAVLVTNSEDYDSMDIAEGNCEQMKAVITVSK